MLFFKYFQSYNILNIIFVGFSMRQLLILKELEDTARYASLLLAPAESFGLQPRLFLPFGQEKTLLYCFGLIVVHFWFAVVTLVTSELLKVEVVRSNGCTLILRICPIFFTLNTKQEN